MKQYYVNLIFAIVLLIVIAFEFFYFTPLGIKIGYAISGGSKTMNNEETNPDILLFNYEEAIDAYVSFKDETNPQAQRWAKKAKDNANYFAKKYNEIVGKDILKIIGD